MADSCSENCEFFGFTQAIDAEGNVVHALPEGGFGSNWWCSLHKRRIKDPSRKCKGHRDRYKQTVKKEDGE